MANNYMGNMTFGVNFKVDTKALDQLDTQFTNMLAGITNFTRAANRSGDNVLKQQAVDAKKAYDQLYQAMSKAYNTKLGQFDLTKVNANLKSVGTNLSTVVTQLNNAGQNVNTILSGFLGNKLMIKETSQFLDKMAITFGNTVRWSATTKILNTITGSVQKAFYFTKDLDRSLNDIRVVTGKSADEMERFAKQATNAAQALGRTTTDYTKASLLYYQQGLSDKEVAARTETTLKAANVTGQSTSEVSEQLTSVWNGYRVSAAETEKYVDKLAAVAASTASDLEELSTGMSKVASAANMMGVDIDQLNAQLSTVISVTRQAPETIGAAFKTIYSRMSTIKSGGIDEEDGATLTSYTEKMGQFGISVLDANGKLRDMGEVIEEIGNKWDTFSREAQVGLAQAMGGTRQYSNLTALFENWDKYQSALQTSQNAVGTLEKQQEIYMDSIAAHFEQLTAEAEKFYEAIFDEDALKNMADGLKFLMEELNLFIKSIGGGNVALTNFGATLVNLFSNQIGQSISKIQNNIIIGKEQKANVNAVSQLAEDIQKGNLTNNNIVNGPVTADSVRTSIQDNQVVMSNEVLQKQAATQQTILNVSQQLGTEAYNRLTAENEIISTLNAEYESYKVVETEIQNTTKQGLTADEVKERLEKSNIEAETKELAILEQKLQALDNEIKDRDKLKNIILETNEKLQGGSQKSFQYQIDLNKKAQDYAQERVNTAQKNINDFNSFRTSGNNLTQGLNNNDTIKITSRTNQAYQQELKTMQEMLIVKSKTATLSNNENIALQTINKILSNNKATVSQINSINQNLNKTQDDLNNKLKEEEEALRKAKEHGEELAKSQAATQKEAENAANAYTKTLNKKSAKQLLNERDDLSEKIINRREELDKNLDAERYRDFLPILNNGANGEADRKKNEADSRQSNVDAEAAAAKIQQQWSKAIRGISGGVRAATALTGGLITALDETADGTTRASGAWEAFSGTLTGTLSAINPAVGMIASGVMGLVKTILDATGATKELGKLLQSDTEKMQEARQSIVDVTKSLDELNQKSAQQRSLTATYHEQRKTLEDMKESWTKLNSKLNSHIALTKEEREEYNSIKDALMNANDKIVEEYDDQHNAIIKNNDALQETLDKLEEEYQLQLKINNISPEDRLGKLNASYQAERDYELNKESLTKSSQKDTFAALVNLWSQGQILDVNNDSWGGTSGPILSTARSSRTGDIQELRDNGKAIEATIIENFATKWNGNIEKMIEEIDEATAENLINAITVAGDELSGSFLGTFGDSDDYKAAFEWLREIAKNNANKEQTDLDKAQEEVREEFIKDFNQTLKESTAFSQSNNSIVSSIAARYGEKNFDVLTRSKAEGTWTTEDIESWTDKGITNTGKYINKLNQYSGQLEKTASAFDNLQLNKSQMTIQQYADKQQELYNQLPELLKEDTNVIESIFGSNGVNPLEGINETFLPLASLLSGDNLSKFVAFAKSTEDFSHYGSDLLSQFEGFKSEKYGVPIFGDALPEIMDALDSIKETSLDGSALDEETFELLNKQLNEYQGHLTNVSTEVGILQDTSLYGTQVWYESLQRIEDELQKAQEQILLDERSKLIVDIEADNTIAKEELNDLINQDYKIIADIEVQHKDSYETAVKEVENLQKALSYVGEEGKVAADNVLGLLNAFPELNDMITELNSDGSISLTKEQIELIKQRTQVDIDGTIAAREMELQTQLNRVQQEKKRVQEQIELTENSLKAYKDGTDNKAEFEEAFLRIYTKYNDTQEEITEENNDAISTDTWQTADAISQYWVDAYKDADAAYAKFVDNVVEGNKVLRGETKDWTHQEYNVSSGVAQVKGKDNATDSQKLLDEATKKAQDAQDATEEFYNQVILNLRKEFESLGMTEEEIENEMISLHAIGLKNVDDAKNLGKATKETVKQGKDLYDVYHNVNKELEFINQKLTVLQKKQKLLKDKDLLNNLKAQTKEYNNQIEAINEKIAIQRGYDEELRTRQTNALGDKGLAAYGVKFDSDGNITNYEDIAKKLQASQNSDEAVKNYENFINEVKTYEENHKLLLELEGQLYDAVAKRQELMGQAIQAKIELILDVSKAEKQYLEFTKKLGSFEVNLILNPDQTSVDAAVAEVSTEFIQSTLEAMPKMNKLMKKGNKALDQLQANVISGNGKSVKWNGQEYKPEDIYQLQEDVGKLGESITQSAEDIQQAYQGTIDAYSNALKELNDWDKRVLARYDMINGVYDHAEKLTKLWYGEDSLEAQSMLTNLSREKSDNLAGKAQEANEQVKRSWQEYQDALSTGNAKLAQEAYDMWADSITNLQSLTEQFAEQRKKQLNDEVSLAAKIVETQLYGGKSREEMMNSWELLNKQAEMYLDTINAQFGVTQLENKYLQTINKSVGNSKAQEKLNKIMGEEMKMLKEKDKLTKYDLERAEAKYDLTLKQIALEEARDNKTNLRLRRDSQGNYTYQYTANEDDILKAQNDVDIARNNLYNMDKKQTESLAQQAFEAEGEYAQKLAELRQKFADDDEARKAAEAELYNAYYGESGILTGILAEWETANKNIGESIDYSLNGQGEGTVLNSFEKLKQNLPNEIAKLSPALDPATQTIINKWTDEETGVASAYKILEEKTNTFFEDYKADIEKFATDINQDTTFGAVRKAFDDTKAKVDEFKDAAAIATTAIGELNTAGFEFSFESLMGEMQGVSDLFGDKDSGLIWQINKANSELKKLVNPEKKIENLQTIKDALEEQRKQIEANEQTFKSAKKQVKKYFQEMINQATTATAIANGVTEAINKIPTSKTSTITTIHVDKYETSGKSDGSGSGGGDKIDLTPKDDDNDNKMYYYLSHNLNGTQVVYGGMYFENESDAKKMLASIVDPEIKMSSQVLSIQAGALKDSPKDRSVYYYSSGWKKKTASFDTGGYTGVWGDQSKLAMLHEKELVLNKVDTENLLKAVDIIRQIDIGKLEANMIDTFLAAERHGVLAPAAASESGIEQNITINAEFPDAKDRDEIKAAFDSLVNLATQRAYTRKH